MSNQARGPPGCLVGDDRDDRDEASAHLDDLVDDGQEHKERA